MGIKSEIRVQEKLEMGEWGELQIENVRNRNFKKIQTEGVKLETGVGVQSKILIESRVYLAIFAVLAGVMDIIRLRTATLATLALPVARTHFLLACCLRKMQLLNDDVGECWGELEVCI